MQSPANWKVEYCAQPTASFRNDKFELSLKISPIYRSSVSQRRGKAENPQSYRVQILQDWFSSGMYGDHTRATKVESWDEATGTAIMFMENFNQDRGGIPNDKIEAVHRGANDSAAAEALLTVDAATEAIVESVGYSDELLRDTVAEETNGQHRVIAHRTGDDIEYLVGEDDESLDTVELKKVYASFPVSTLGINALFPLKTILVQQITLSGYLVYRFIFNERTETNIILNEGSKVVEPIFTQSIRDIVESKWSAL